MESDTHTPRTFFRNRFSNASLFSIRTLLPQYSVVDALKEPVGSPLDTDCGSPTHPVSSWNTGPSSGSTSDQRPIEPPQYSLRHSLGNVAGEFRYSYPIKSKKPWAMLHLDIERDPVLGNPHPLQSKPRVPRFWGRDPIRGILELDLDTPHNIHQIDILLNGRIVTSSLLDGTHPFLGHGFTLWEKSMGDPDPDPDPSSGADAQKKKIDGKFVPGRYTFPFSFPFPIQSDPTTKSTVNATLISPFRPLSAGGIQSAVSTSCIREPIPTIGGKKKRISWTSRFTSNVSPPNMDEKSSSSPPSSPGSATLPRVRHNLPSPLPQSFVEKGINLDVAYEISARIVHGRLRASSWIRANVSYIPASHPFPVSQKRKEAYEEGGLLPCPMDDPEGWFAFPTFTIYGMTNVDGNPRHTKADCTLYLSQPLSYTRGSVIPCFLTISGTDEQVVQLLSSCKMPIVRLLRRIRHPEIMDDNPSPDYPLGGVATNYKLTYLASILTKWVSHEVGRARWWLPSKDVHQTANVRHLEGEIHLSPSLHPNCDIPLFQIEYVVEMLSFRTDKFEPEVHPSSLGRSRRQDNVLASNPVEITTLYREDEPIPVVYSEPPKTHIIRRVDSDDKKDKIAEEDE